MTGSAQGASRTASQKTILTSTAADSTSRAGSTANSGGQRAAILAGNNANLGGKKLKNDI